MRKNNYTSWSIGLLVRPLLYRGVDRTDQWKRTTNGLLMDHQRTRDEAALNQVQENGKPGLTRIAKTAFGPPLKDKTLLYEKI